MKKWTTLITLVLLVVAAGFGTAYADDALALQLKQADELFAKAEPATLKEAGAIYEALVERYATNYEVLWKTARFYEKVARSTSKPLDLFEKGKALAEQATNLYPDKVEGHYWLASLTGRVGEEKGILNSLFMVKPMKAELDLCVQLDPNFPDSYYVLGLLYWKVPGWPLSIGDKKQAIEYALKAVELKPQSFIFQWGLYQAYDAAGKKKEARAVLEQIISMPVAPGEEVDAKNYKQRAEDALKNN